MSKRFALRDDQWNCVKDLLPGRQETVVVTAKDDRLFIDAVFYRYRVGIPWRDLPERFGDFRLIYARHSRWAKTSVFVDLAKDSDNENAMINSTIVRAHQHNAAAQKKTEKIRRWVDNPPGN